MEEEWRPGLWGQMAGREHEGSEHGTSALTGGDQWIAQVGDHQIPERVAGAMPRREHNCSEHGTSALPGGDHWIS